MSTDFHRLRSPVTCVRVTEGPAHDRVSVWTDHALAGTLTVTAGQGRGMALNLTRADAAVTRVGIGNGCAALTLADRSPTEDEYLVSDYGDVVTLRELRAAPGVVRVVPRRKAWSEVGC